MFHNLDIRSETAAGLESGNEFSAVYCTGGERVHQNITDHEQELLVSFC